jgi:hypothetical protein
VVRVLPDPPLADGEMLRLTLDDSAHTHKDLKRPGAEAGVAFFDNQGRSERLDEDPGVS